MGRRRTKEPWGEGTGFQEGKVEDCEEGEDQGEDKKGDNGRRVEEDNGF